jgi:hypothetical protein
MCILRRKSHQDGKVHENYRRIKRPRPRQPNPKKQTNKSKRNCTQKKYSTTQMTDLHHELFLWARKLQLKQLNYRCLDGFVVVAKKP